MTKVHSRQSGNVQSTSGPDDTLRLEAIAGPPIDRIVIDADGPVVLGRSSVVDRQLPDKTISRRHFRILKRGDHWLMTDLDSRHGTYLNGIRLEPEIPAPIGDGDLIRVGPWTLRVIDNADRSTSMPTANDLVTTSHRVQRVPVRELRSVAQQRLDLLIECCAAINAATTETELAERALEAVTRGTGFRRAAFIRQVSGDGDVQLIASAGTDRIDPDDPTQRGPGEPFPASFAFSRSLINAAGGGEIVRMTGDSGVNYGESIIRLGIHAALCAPIMLGDAVEAYLYLDARDAEDSIAHDAAAFCQAISRMCGLALGNLKRVEHEKKNALLSDEIRAAREAQVRLMPRAIDTVGAFEYAMQSKPGRTVAGDLFDIVALDGGRLAVFLGDVIGKGAGAAILMATAQAEIRMALTLGRSPEDAIRMTNRSLANRSAEGEFVSLWLGVLDPKS
ncbi:MAG TPA: FHA domain-containing protein, partial [Phycisphaerales bacterium]|nr:FHA domain-containing protein [Phycisphaerales bacterium]